MKQIGIQLQDHYDGFATTTCGLVRIRATNGMLFGLTDLDVDIDYDAAPAGPGKPGDNFGMMTHRSDSGGVSISKMESAADLTVGNAELTTIPTNILTPEALMEGLLNGAEVYIYRVNYMDLSQGHELVEYGFADVARMEGQQAVIAFRTQSDLLKEPEVVLWSKTCDHEFGGIRCPKEFVWVEGTVTAVSDEEPGRIFGSDIVAVDDFYNVGVAHWLTGDNAGREMETEQNTGGTFALALDMEHEIKIGDTFKVRQHCSKVYDDDKWGCLHHWGAADRNKYFGGCPDIPTADGGSSMVPGNNLSSDDGN